MQTHSTGKYYGLILEIPQGQGDDNNPVMHPDIYSGLHYLDIILRDFNFITLHVHMYDSSNTLLASITVHKNPDLYTIVNGEEQPSYYTLRDYFMAQNPLITFPNAIYFKFEFVTETVPTVAAITKHVEIKYFSSNQSVCNGFVQAITDIWQNSQNVTNDLQTLANNGMPSGGQSPILLSSD